MQLVDVKGGKVEPNEHDMKQVGSRIKYSVHTRLILDELSGVIAIPLCSHTQ